MTVVYRVCLESNAIFLCWYLKLSARMVGETLLSQNDKFNMRKVYAKLVPKLLTDN